MITARFKRFYEVVGVAAVDRGLSDGGFAVTLDGRPVKTPAKADMVLPSLDLSEALAAEWRAQGEDVDTRSLALTGLVWTAIDLVRPNREGIIEEVAGYGAHDLVCYRAEAPEDLVARQHDLWQPLLVWVALSLDAPLAVTSGIVPITQPPDTLATLRGAVAAKEDFELTALSAAAAAAGSLVIGLALGAGRIDAEAAFAAAQLDESYQIERWGKDSEAAERRAAIKADLEAVARFLSLLPG